MSAREEVRKKNMMRLCEKLCRELAQAEHDAIIHTTREARRLGATPPADKLLAIALHAQQLRPRFDALVTLKRPIGVRVARVVANVFSTTRHLFADRLLASERSYRATLLGLRHGIDTARLLAEVVRRQDQARLFDFCNDLIAGREPLLRDAERALAWFADHPTVAVASGLRIGLLGTGAPARKLTEARERA
jgi:hypothetical protein